MLISCKECKAMYCIADSIVDNSSRKFKCTRCQHVWKINENDHINLSKKRSIKVSKLFTPIFLSIVIILINFIFFPEFFIKISPFKEVYEKCGIYNSDGLLLDEFIFEVNNNDLLVKGIIRNESDEDKSFPDVRYILLDGNKNIIFKYTHISSKKIIKAKDFSTIDTKILNVMDEAVYLQLDIGNKLELLLK